MESEREKYQKELVDIIMNIERLDVLIYLHRLVSKIVKEGR